MTITLKDLESKLIMMQRRKVARFDSEIAKTNFKENVQRISLTRRGCSLRIGLPKGNLNRPDDNTGYVLLLLKKAGFDMTGYDPDDELSTPTARGEDRIEFYCMKPNQLPILLEENAIDIAIIGSDTLNERYSQLWKTKDWLDKRDITKQQEREILEFDGEHWWTGLLERDYIKRISDNCLQLSGGTEIKTSRKRIAKWRRFRKEIEKHFLHFSQTRNAERYSVCELANLGLGKVDICWGVPEQEDITDKMTYGRIHLCANIASAYPNITYGEICRSVDEMFINSVGDLREDGSLFGYKAKIFPLKSKTEAMIKLGLADIVVDCVASRKSFDKHKITRMGQPIFSSTARIYARGVVGEEYRKLKQELRPSKRHYANIQVLDDVVTRLERAAKEYALERKDSIWYPGGQK